MKHHSSCQCSTLGLLDGTKPLQVNSIKKEKLHFLKHIFMWLLLWNGYHKIEEEYPLKEKLL